VKVNSIDLYILVAYMIGVVLWGMWIGRRQRDVTDYVVSGRDLPWWAVLGSIVATETSTVTFLSIPGFAWGNDLTWLQLPMGFIIGRFVVALLLLPRFFSGNFFTAYQVLHAPWRMGYASI
jgi:Na+/proline symporter